MNALCRGRTAALLVLAAAMPLLGCAGGKKVEYLTAPVQRGDLTITVSATGTLNPVKLINVGTQVSGTVKVLNVDYNSRVQRDEVLARLDERTYAAAVRQSEANVASATASRALALANVKRAEDLFAKGYVAQQDLDTARQQVATTTAQRDLVLAQRSPVSGLVVSREVDVGQTVAASFQTPTLFKIAQDLSKMQIDSSFAEADVGRLRVDQSVRFTVDAFPDRMFEGIVRQIRLNPTTVQNVVTYDVVVGVDNLDQILLPGMTAYVNVILSEKHAVLAVPNAALRFRPPGVEAPGIPATAGVAAGAKAGAGDAGRGAGAAGHGAGARRGGGPRAIYVLRKGAPVAVQVRLGGTDRRSTEVVEGDLKEGDEVIVGLAGTAGGTAPGGSAGSAPRVRMF
ncbi:MAG: efflux RND transporter periplasmic adaptor subunit [Proteobacteria bacterium]|nr:efflux RND transporter periplasmic adaptor subunit [Pseudomonadota bacterium]